MVTGMTAQTSLPGFAPAAPTDRLFLAVFPDQSTVARLNALAADQCARHGLRGRPLLPERFHVTLLHLGDWAGLPSDVVEATTKAAAQVRSAAFDVVFDRVASFDGRRDKLPFVLRADGGNAPLRAFQAQLGVRLREAGVAPAGTGFEPHVTLAYDARKVAAEPVAPIGWRVDEFVLVHSLLGRTRHIRLGCWPLA
jgi:2'-5' RNA ligase